jgi:hypothetical protein
MLIHVLGNVRDVEVSVALVSELLELGVKRFLSIVSKEGLTPDLMVGNLPERS